MTSSPYSGQSESKWRAITEQLVGAHPLKTSVLLEAATQTWANLWETTIGKRPVSVKLSELKVPATVVGYLFEILLTRELSRLQPTVWRGTQSKDEKDLVCVSDPLQSVEIKTSGQRGFKVFGNRSYGQKSENDLLVKKEKSGFYVTINFFERTLTLIRFGWIDSDDWIPQAAPTGQMAGLKQVVYNHKLIAIPGRYRQEIPVRLLNQVGAQIDGKFAELNIRTVGDLLRYRGELPAGLTRIKKLNDQFLSDSVDRPGR
jgi:hypothetical protein